MCISVLLFMAVLVSVSINIGILKKLMLVSINVSVFSVNVLVCYGASFSIDQYLY